MSLRFKRPSTVSEPVEKRKSLLSPDFSGTVTYLDRLKPESIKSGVMVTSKNYPNPGGVIEIPKYNGYWESRYTEAGYIENTN